MMRTRKWDEEPAINWEINACIVLNMVRWMIRCVLFFSCRRLSDFGNVGFGRCSI